MLFRFCRNVLESVLGSKIQPQRVHHLYFNSWERSEEARKEEWKKVLLQMLQICFFKNEGYGIKPKVMEEL